MSTELYCPHTPDFREVSGSGWIALGLVVLWFATLLISLAAMWSPSWMNEDGWVERGVGLAHGLAVVPGLILPALLCLEEVRQRLSPWEVTSWIALGLCAYTSFWQFIL